MGEVSAGTARPQTGSGPGSVPEAGPSAPKGQERPPEPPQRLELQWGRSLAENLADLPRVWEGGCQRNRKGQQERWMGYKFHRDTMDGDIPVSPRLTSASVPDAPPAIALAQMTAQRVTSLYDLRDCA